MVGVLYLEEEGEHGEGDEGDSEPAGAAEEEGAPAGGKEFFEVGVEADGCHCPDDEVFGCGFEEGKEGAGVEVPGVKGVFYCRGVAEGGDE